MTKKKKLYEGKAKIIYEGKTSDTLIQYFKDDITAFNKEKHDIYEGKGVLNNRISEYLMLSLEKIGIQTHFMERQSMREQVIKKLDMIPLEVVIRNYAAGTICKRFGLERGFQLARPIIEFYLKDDALGDPLVCEDHISAFNWAATQEIDEIMSTALRINDFLSGVFLCANIKLVDFKIEFGRLYEGDTMRIILGDEISPDSCRLWDLDTGDIMDKDRYRQNLGQVVEYYREVATRLGIVQNSNIPNKKGKPVLVSDNKDK